MINRIATFVGQVVGLIFLISGFAKAADATLFANLLGNYGSLWFGIVSPLIILCEVLLGLLLVFRIYMRQTAVLASIFTVILTLAYTYGLFFQEITDCGCFGRISFLNRSPWFTYIRNTLMLVALIPAALYADYKYLTISNILYMSCVFCIACFMTGFSFRHAQVLKHKKKTSTFRHIPLSRSSLSEFISVSPDSTYLVFAFSYSCPYCLNSINNVDQYERVGVVDKVIGLVAEDDTAKDFFYQYFSPSFEIHELPMEQMMRFCKSLSTSYFLHGDTITKTYEGLAINPVLLISRQ